MVYAGYLINDFSKITHMDNSAILTGRLSFLESKATKEPLPKFQLPVFQPTVLQRVPEVDNGRILFPISLPDFVYPDGVRVLSGFEVETRKAHFKEM
jgi:hypothetical protein